ncbi:hypothetical protein ACLOAV_007656 [Pseudogymnoascus australis]
MSQATRELKIYRKDAKSNHSLLTPAEREKLIAPFLPEPHSRSKSGNGENDERTHRSVLKGYIPTTHRAVTRKLASYFGRQHPALSIRAPHIPSMESSPTTPPTDADVPVSLGQLSVLLISEEDGEDSIVDLTKTLTEMSQRSKITPKDITVDLVDAELSESVMSGPELLILFGPTIELDGYPPWQISLTEIYNVQDNQGVGYQVFLRALYNYANAQMRFGR